MHVALGADDASRLVDAIADFLKAAGHQVTRFGKAAGEGENENETWADTGRRVAQAVASRTHELGVVCCWTGTGVSIAANKVPEIGRAHV